MEANLNTDLDEKGDVRKYLLSGLIDRHFGKILGLSKSILT
jgi:hypothetical protein